MTDIEATFPLGHNGGPPLDLDDDVAMRRIDDLYDEARLWADGEPITSQEMHDVVSTLHEALHEAGKVAEELRIAEKRPLDDAVDAVQKKWNPYVQPKKGRVALGKEALGVLLAAWRKKVADEKAAVAKKAADEAAALQAAAQDAMRSSSGNLEARERAEEVVSFAKDAQRYANKKTREATTGSGLRSVWSARLVDESAALTWAYETHHASFADFVQGLADTAVKNGARIVPGFEVREDKVATI